MRVKFECEDGGGMDFGLTSPLSKVIFDTKYYTVTLTNTSEGWIVVEELKSKEPV